MYAPADSRRVVLLFFMPEPPAFRLHSRWLGGTACSDHGAAPECATDGVARFHFERT